MVTTIKKEDETSSFLANHDESSSSSSSSSERKKYAPPSKNKHCSPSPLRHSEYSSSSLASTNSAAGAGAGIAPFRPSSSFIARRRPSGNALSNLGYSDFTDFEELGCPIRRYSFSVNDYSKMNPEMPFFQRLLSSHHSVTNPNSPFDAYVAANKSSPQLSSPLFHIQDGSSASLGNEFGSAAEPRRLSIIDIVNNLRPSKLIGSIKPLCNWYAFYKDNVKKIKNRKVRKYYKEQNYLITKFQEIDNFLDAGKIHYNMLSNYGNDSSNGRIALDNIEEIDETIKPNSAEGERTSTESKTGYKNFQNEESPNNKTLQSEHRSTTSQDLERTIGGDIPASKFSRFYDVPGNVDNDGGKFLGFNQEEDSLQVLKAILVNFLVNIILLIGKIIVALLTSSLSVAASLVDSILDFLSTFIIYIVHRLAGQNDWRVEHSYPIGRSRLEPLGVLIFSIIIIISFFQVGQESFKRLVFSTLEQKVPATIGLDAIAIMVVTIVSKFACWVWCSKSQSSSVQALAQDAMSDVVFNTVSLSMPWLGHVCNIWWFDPLGGLLLSAYIVVNWGKTAFEHINNLTGAVANPLDYKIILYMALRFAEPIKQITALKVYHVGDNLNVEIDVVFANDKFNLSFKDCHDIAEALQYSIESLPMVERAFVHIDYMEGNYKGHLK
ncbi:hypothetical protein KGF56_002186 [Candida oxycetoniae]|uniref:Cation efflux protein transmembrane domain-containing protein n=1 Tax=Candida oxycetoniae TaxID=497107 RepID=A0AAI9SYC4_9ASCO|nr:uncharacterized protein KGF56_002186 [Candida oxycetoniae]KAI3405021.2 hypothetical protein KGF56_002186 [Candida oxycetoniae]